MVNKTPGLTSTTAGNKSRCQTRTVRAFPMRRKTLTASSTGLWIGQTGHQMLGLAMRARKGGQGWAKEQDRGMTTPNMEADPLRLRRQHLLGRENRGGADKWEA